MDYRNQMRDELVEAIKNTSGFEEVELYSDRTLAMCVRAHAELYYLQVIPLGSDRDENIIREALRSLRNTGKLPFEV